MRPSVRRRSRWRQITGWVTAYALALYALLAAAILPHMASGSLGDEASAFTLCVTDLSGSAPPSDETPASIDCEFHCTLARGSLTLAAGPASAIVIEYETGSIPSGRRKPSPKSHPIHSRATTRTSARRVNYARLRSRVRPFMRLQPRRLSHAHSNWARGPVGPRGGACLS